MTDVSREVLTDIFRQYNHLVSQGITAGEVTEMLGRIFGDSFNTIYNEYDSLREFEDDSSHDVILLFKLRECLPAAIVDERLLIFHYRSMVFGIDEATRKAQQKVKNSMNYVTAVSVVAIAMFGFSEFYIQPMMIDIFESFRAPPPDGWRLIHGITLALLPFVLGWLGITHWLIGRHGDSTRYFNLATNSRRLPLLSPIGDSFRSYVITSFVRYAGSLQVAPQQALDTVRQAIAIAFDDVPRAQNAHVLERVINNLASAEQLGTFVAELGFWDNKSKADVALQVENLASGVEATHMSLMGLFVGSIIIQIYLWIFSMGAAFA
ncbi:MAG: hypothetical protein ACFHX7_04090 [Pseudomonadota bacterium]